jgi:hypothetical protein
MVATNELDRQHSLAARREEIRLARQQHTKTRSQVLIDLLWACLKPDAQPSALCREA